MCLSIPEWSTLTKKLYDLVEMTYKSVGSRTKHSIRVNLPHSWTEVHVEAFNRLRDQIATSPELAYPKSAYQTCVFKNRTDRHWVPYSSKYWYLTLVRLNKMKTTTPGFLSCKTCTDSSLNWSTPKKEWSSIVEWMMIMGYLLNTTVVPIFTDHENLVYISDLIG